ncbi:hypothetical protein QYE76_042101 [Lolium multiflorum]|uniref:Transposase (putative) gypsy type domain-containing protein n=1 Tax=Lolium multiflorum TaxID=4521 RepID=A0AAD8TG13_LOLMU|nr:hypothetical protein QYE76_042101 [Lolium multiflorum]
MGEIQDLKQDMSAFKKLGLMKKEGALIFPRDESFPTPRIGYRVTFVGHLIRGLYTPIHEFLRGLLFIYGIQLHHLTPNSILHISIFITLCECFFGTHPHWGLWKRIFYLHRNNSRNVAYNVGGVVICIRSDVDYFDVKFPDSVQGWRKRWLYIQEEQNNSPEYNIAPFDGAAKILRRRSWDAEATAEEKSATDALMKRIRELQNTRGKELSGVQITAHFLRIRVQPLQARKNPLWMYSGEEDVDRLSKDLSVKDLEKLVRRFTSLSKKHSVPSSCCVTPYSSNHALPEPLMKHFINLGTQFIEYHDTVENLKGSLDKANTHADDLDLKLEQSETTRKKAEQDIAREEAIIARFESQNRRFVRKMGEDFTLHEAEEDRLLDTLSILELHGDLARKNISEARAAFTRLFPYFFPKQTQPKIFSELTRRFLPKEDLGLAFRQENLKDRAARVREYLDFCTKTLAMVYNAMFPWNLQPKTLPDLIDKFKSVHRIHGFVKAQLMAGARFAMIMLQIYCPKLDMSNIVDVCHAKLRKRRRNVDKIIDVVTPVAEKMIDDLLRMDTAFFTENHYVDSMGASAEDDRINIDELMKDD